MRFDRYEASHQRSRLAGQLQARATRAGMPAIVLVLFGLPFVAVGLGAMLAGTGHIPLAAPKMNAPLWILAVFGLVFALAGGVVWNMAWRLHRANRRLRELGERNPELADYPWDQCGFTPPRWSRVIKGIGLLIFLALFLSMFNWWAFWSNGPWPVKMIVGLFDLFLVLAVWQVIMALGHALKFGPSRIEFGRFPFRPGETVSLYWQVPRGMARAANGNFTLRCVEEWYETRGSGRNRKRTLVQEQIWSGIGHLDQPCEILPGKTEELQFALPAEAVGTALSYRGSKAVFWELVIHLDLAGLDFRESYLVPVYRQAGGGGSSEPASLRLEQ